MVSLKKYLIISLFVLIAGHCGATDSSDIIIDGVKFKLSNNILKYELDGTIKELDLNIEGKIQFIKRDDNTIQIENTEWGKVIAVAVSDKVPNSDDCNTTIKGIVIKNSKVNISPVVQNIATCGYGPMDQLMFINFAYALDKKLDK